MIPIADIQESKTNPRRAMDSTQLQELADSIAKVGVLSPLLVRAVNGHFELVAGHRRLRAAKLAGLSEVPAVVKELTDEEVLEVQLVENLQRADIHPLDEAHGYHKLMRKKYDAARIAERVGRSVKYVYDRIKLLSLTKEAQQIFLDGKITAGHAVILARLSERDQERAISPHVNRSGPGNGLWQGEHSLFDPEDEGAPEDPYGGLKPVSVRELQSWVDRTVRFDHKSVDSMLFPDTAAAVERCMDEDRPALRGMVPITYDHGLSPDLKGDERTVCVQSWKRADGKLGSKTCEQSLLGVLVVGRDRGQAFDVCIAKKQCKVHWAKEQRYRAKRANAATKESGKTARSRYEVEEERRKKEQEEEEAKHRQWVEARPEILPAIADAVKKAPAKATGFLADLVIGQCNSNWHTRSFKFGDYVARGSSAEDLLRYAAFMVLVSELHQYGAFRDFPKRAKALGIDLKKILDEHAPEDKPAAETKSKKKVAARKPKK